MNDANNGRKKYAWWLIGVAAAVILIYLGVSNISVLADTFSWCMSLISPLLVGFGIAVILNVPMRFFESHFWPNAKKKFLIKIRRPLAFFVSIVAILTVLAGVIYLVIPELVEAVTMVVELVIEYVDKFNNMTREEIAALPFGDLLLNIDWHSILDDLTGWLKNESMNILGSAVDVVSTLVGGIYDAFIALIFAAYIIFSKDTLISQSKRMCRTWLPRHFGDWLIHACSVTCENFRNFISGQTLEAVILGLLCTIGMLILQIPFAPMVGALVGVTALIPVVGAFVGAGIGAFMILTVSPTKALIFLIFLLVLQQVEENLIYPRVMGSRVNLPAIWILAAVIIGGGIYGPLGMLLSVPLASTAYTLLREATHKRERMRKLKRHIVTKQQ